MRTLRKKKNNKTIRRRIKKKNKTRGGGLYSTTINNVPLNGISINLFKITQETQETQDKSTSTYTVISKVNGSNDIGSNMYHTKIFSVKNPDGAGAVLMYSDENINYRGVIETDMIPRLNALMIIKLLNVTGTDVIGFTQTIRSKLKELYSYKITDRIQMWHINSELNRNFYENPLIEIDDMTKIQLIGKILGIQTIKHLQSLYDVIKPYITEKEMTIDKLWYDLKERK